MSNTLICSGRFVRNLVVRAFRIDGSTYNLGFRFANTRIHENPCWVGISSTE